MNQTEILAVTEGPVKMFNIIGVIIGVAFLLMFLYMMYKLIIDR